MPSAPLKGQGLLGRFADELERDWKAIARPSQLPPHWRGRWRIWLLLAGRGFGKTRAGAEWVRALVERKRAGRIALVGPTSADCRDVMIEGESGILSVCPDWNRPTYEPSKRRLTWPNGALATTFSADEPERLRGPQHDAAWCDEVCTWRYPSAWDNLQLGMRLGRNPRTVITTTPKPTKLIRDLVARDGRDVVVTRGSTRENADNLAPAFLAEIMSRYEGTRLGRQELDAELLEDVPGALWTRDLIERARVGAAPELRRVVVAIDPSGNKGDEGDETGIVVAALGADGRGYVIEDLSARLAPSEWAKRAVAAYKLHHADRIVAEANFGGAMVETTLRTVDPTVAFKAVQASRGKVVRAEPVAALYEQNRILHLGAFPALEDQMCAFTVDFDRVRFGGSPDRVDALVWALTELMLGENVQVWVDHFTRLAENKGKIEMPASKPPTSIAAAYAAVAAPKAPPEIRTVTLHAPGPFQTFGMRQGRRYTSNEASLVENVLPEDVAALIESGCWPIQEVA